MRILVLVKHGYGESGGIAQYTQDLLASLLKSKNSKSITVLAQVQEKVDSSLIPKDLSYYQVSRDSRLLYVVKSTFLMLKGKYDLIVCTHLFLLPAVLPFMVFSSAKSVLCVYGIEAWKPKNQFLKYLTSKLDLVISISNLTLDRFSKWAMVSKSEKRILAPAVSREKFFPDEKNPTLVNMHSLEGKKIILTVSRLVKGRSKGHDLLIDIFPELLKIDSNLTYLIVGDGNDRMRLQDKVQELGLSESIFFLGHIAEEEKSNYYRLADVFFMVGEGEGFGIVYLEALACGVPVIASSADASAEVIEAIGSGLVIDPSSKEELKASIFSSLKENKQVPLDLENYYLENYQNRVDEILQSFLSVS